MTNARASRTKRPAKTKPERISAAHMERHREMLVHAHEVEQLQRQTADLIGALNVWGQDLARHYNLGPTDRVLEDGTIFRDPNAARVAAERNT